MKTIKLSHTHIRILDYIIQGKSRKEIATKMKLKVSTLGSYLRDMNRDNECTLNQLVWRYAHVVGHHTEKPKYKLKIV